MKSTAAAAAAARAIVRSGQFLRAGITELWHWALAASTGWARPPEVIVRRTCVHRLGQPSQLLEEYQCFRLVGTRTEIKHGYYRAYRANSGPAVTACHCRHGQCPGQSEDYREWGAPRHPASMAHYRKGQRHGPATVYAAWGKEEEGRYAHDLREGQWVYYRPDGSRSVCFYKAGKLHGELVAYGPSYREQGRLYYEHGQLVTGTRTQYYANGKARRKVSYVAGRRQKWTQSWYGLGRLESRSLFSTLVQRLFYGSAPKPPNFHQPQLLFWSNSQLPQGLGCDVCPAAMADWTD